MFDGEYGGPVLPGIAQWDGSTWSALGSGIGEVKALVADGAGHLFVGGYWSGNKVSPNIAQANVSGALGHFWDLAYLPATGFTFTFSGASAGQPYRIQTTASLASGSWTDFTNFTYTGPTVIRDTAGVGTTNRFYRAVSP
jgi:hypothetical protein